MPKGRARMRRKSREGLLKFSREEKESPHCLGICRGFMGFPRSSFTVSCKHLEHGAYGSWSTQSNPSGQQAQWLEPPSCAGCLVHRCFCLRWSKAVPSQGHPSPPASFPEASLGLPTSPGDTCLLFVGRRALLASSSEVSS